MLLRNMLHRVGFILLSVSLLVMPRLTLSFVSFSSTSICRSLLRMSTDSTGKGKVLVLGGTGFLGQVRFVVWCSLDCKCVKFYSLFHTLLFMFQFRRSPRELFWKGTALPACHGEAFSQNLNLSRRLLTA